MTITGATAVYGLLGDPVAHSLSPRLCNHAFATLDIDAVYVPLPCDPRRPDVVLAGCEALGLAGGNVTYPLKTAVIPHLAACSSVAEALGAVNLLVRMPMGSFRGENTDAPGVPLALQTWLDWAADGRAVAILGGGGAARAAAYGLLATGATSVTFMVRDTGRAEAGIDRLRAGVGRDRIHLVSLADAAAFSVLAEVDLVVQATPVGLGDPCADRLIEPEHAPRAVGFELNYGSRPTAFARAWRKTGRGCLDGRDLLAAQAHAALDVWLGVAPDLAELRALLEPGSPDDEGGSS